MHCIDHFRELFREMLDNYIFVPKLQLLLVTSESRSHDLNSFSLCSFTSALLLTYYFFSARI